MSAESARFELVEGATFQLPDGSSVTVRDGQLELSDGRRLPMPAAGEAITVERTVTRPDGGTTRIKHTIRLSETEPVVETPARPFPGAGPGSDEEDAETAETGETVAAPVSAAAVEAAPAAGDAKPAAGSTETADEVDSSAAAAQPPATPVSETQLPEVPSEEPSKAAAAEAGEEAAITPTEPVVMGVNCGGRRLREMLWGSIPESGFGEDEDEPKAPPKGLLHRSYSIKEEDESEHEGEDEVHEEALESSENADESFEFVEGKGKDAGKGKKAEGPKEPEKDGEDDTAKESEKVSEKEEANQSEAGPEKEQKPAEVSAGLEQDDISAKVKLVTFDSSVKTESSPENTDDTDKEPLASSPKKPSSTGNNPEAAEEPAQESAAESQHEKPHLVRQDKLPSSGNQAVQAEDDVVVRVGVPLFDTAAAATPANSQPEKTTVEESTAQPSSDSAATSGGPRSDEATNDLHLKLTPILRSLESDEPTNAATGGEDKRAPSEDRKGTVPPNTPAVAEDREGLVAADDEEADTVSVPKVVSYYESISPRESPAPARSREAESSAVPKVIKFAEPMEPEKVYLGGLEPEEMEDTPIPRAAEQGARVELAPEPAALRQPTQVLVPVRGTADDQDPLTALAASETAAQQQPSAPEEKSDDPATPSTTPEKDAAADGEQPKSATPHVYDPALFEHEPKRPLILTSEMVEEAAPPYEPGVHDARTLPMGRKSSAVVTEQPPPFGEDERSDPRDPFLPDEPRPGAGFKDDTWMTNCFDLCCCCWAP